METSSMTGAKKGMVREFIEWIIRREDVCISTVYIEYFKKGGDDKDPVVFKFGHKEIFHGKSL